MSLLRNRKVQIAGQAVVITALVGGTAAFVGLNKSVNLTVDGETQNVRTFGTTVDDVLASQGVEVDERDEVQPAASTGIDRGMDITVNTAKDLTVTVDGVDHQEWTTAVTVEQALADLGIEAKGAEVSRDLQDRLSEDTAAISVITPKGVTVVADGKSELVSDTTATVADALTGAGIDLGAEDVVSAPQSSPVADGQVVTVMRVKTEEKKVEEKVAKKVTVKKTDDLFKGQKKVQKAGKDGKKTVTYRIKTVDGKEVKKDKLDENILTEATEEVVLQGTKERSTGASRGGDRDDSGSGSGDTGGKMSTDQIKKMLGGPGSKWYSVVKCESNFNPRAINASNRAHFGLFQFKLATWRSVGGSGNPIDASPQEQFKRAKILQAKAGWGQWSCA